MKLKAKFTIISAVVIGLVLIVGFFVFIQVQELEKVIGENKVAGEIMKGVFELNLLTSDYLLHFGERSQEQWQLRHQSIEEFLKSDIFGHLEEQTILDSLRHDHEVIQTTFLKLTEEPISLELKERLVAELLIKSQTMFSAASRLIEISRLELAATQQKTVLFVMISVAVLAGIILLILLVVVRSILAPVLSLQKGAEIIGTGNFKYRIDINKRKDEIGELTASFNEMATKLKESYSGLEQKIKERTKELQEALEKLKELDKIKDEFLNIASHELKTPLIPIKSQLQLLLAEDFGKFNEEQKKSLEMILRNEERLNRLVSDVLDISRIRSKRLKLIPEELSLEKIIKESIEEMQPVAQEKGITLTAKPIDLPMISADSNRIRQVIGNLLNNAIKFTLEKGKIIIEAEQRKDEVIVRIIDTGIGISAENLKKLFTPFFQAENGLARKYKGTGLGLAICKGIIEAHQGRIWAESEGKGKGSIFSFTLLIR